MTAAGRRAPRAAGAGVEAALKLLALPREVGAHPASGQPILAGIGRYGPWVRHGATYASVPADIPADTLTLERALALLDGVPGRRGRG